nr:collagen alpha-1(I) chain-like [Chlorocebus sabaeus]
MRKPGEGIRCAYFREENREVKHRGVRFREQREGCRGPQGRSWNSGSGTGGPVQAAGRRESQWEAESGTAGRGPPREGRETRKAVGAGSGADNLSNPLWDELGHALPGPGTPACEARPRFLPLPARGGGGGAGLGTPASAAGLVRLPGRLRLGRTPPARSRRVEPWSRGLGRALSLDTGSPARPRGQNLWTPRTPDRLRAAPSRARPWTRPRGPGLAEAAGAGGALLGAEGPAAGGGIPGRGAEEKMSKTQTEGSVNPGPGMQGLLERQPMRSRPWDSTWPARPFPCSVDSVKPDLSSAYSVEVEAD